MRMFVAGLAFIGTVAGTQVRAQVLFPPPIPGTPVSFVACPARTASGSWVAVDPDSYFTYSLKGVGIPPATVYVRVTGVVSPQINDVPGWLLSPISMIVGTVPCRSEGVLQPPRGELFQLPRFDLPFAPR